MQSVVLKKYHTDLVVTESESKALDEDEVRMETAYAGLSFTDRIIQQGLYKYQRQHLPLPYTPGFEASGIVSEVGQQVSNLVPGDKVVVMQKSGCLSSEIKAKSENVIKLLPETDLAWAASWPVNFFTAAHALHNIVKIFPGSDILITSAAGGVGGMLVQLGLKEHKVTGLVGNQVKKKYAEQLGTTSVLTYEEFFQSRQTFDVILVASGRELDKYQCRLKKNGKMIMYGFHSLIPRSPKSLFVAAFHYLKLPALKPFDLVYENKTFAGFNIIHLNSKSNEFFSIKKLFLESLETNSLPNKHKITVYDLSNVNQALQDLATGNTKGKMVVKF